MGFILLVTTLFAWADRPIPEHVDIESKFIFAPVGFDSNDDVMIILDGYLPNTCYRLSPALVDGLGTPTLKVQARAYVAGSNCLPFTVPFTQEVRLGRLAASPNYSVSTNGGGLREILAVEETKPLVGVDDFHYATVDLVEVTYREKDETGNPAHDVRLKGRITSNCLRVAKVDVKTTNGKTVEVLPKLEQLAEGPNGEPCRYEELTFVESRRLPSLSLGRHLIHVRSSGGQAVNRVYTNLVAPQTRAKIR